MNRRELIQAICAAWAVNATGSLTVKAAPPSLHILDSHTIDIRIEGADGTVLARAKSTPIDGQHPTIVFDLEASGVVDRVIAEVPGWGAVPLDVTFNTNVVTTGDCVRVSALRFS